MLSCVTIAADEQYYLSMRLIGLTIKIEAGFSMYIRFFLILIDNYARVP